VGFLLSGFLLGIPVFFDTVFYLMIPLGKALRLRTGHSYLLYVLSIVAGGTMAHSLVPPTPGPLFVAEQLKINLGTMILAGCAVGLATSASGYLYALWANRRWDLPLRDSAESSLADLAELAARDESRLPPLWLSLLPILLPVLFIGGYAVLAPFAARWPRWATRTSRWCWRPASAWGCWSGASGPAAASWLPPCKTR
jgi:GntP family gluconate:H+ symporter